MINIYLSIKSITFWKQWNAMDVLGYTEVPTWAVPDLVCFTMQYSKVLKHFLNSEKIYHDKLLHFYRFFDS